jgi:hypothetical protein
MSRLALAAAVLSGCAATDPSSTQCSGKCDGDQPIPSCTAQQAGSIEVYPAGSTYYYLPDRWVVTRVSITTPIASDIFPADPFEASPYYAQCSVTLGVRPDAAPDAVASAKAALGADVVVAPTSAAQGERPVDVAFAPIDGLPAIDTSTAQFQSAGGGIDVTIAVPAVDCGALATMLVHRIAIANVSAKRTMTCTDGAVPVTVSTLGSQLAYETASVDDDSTIYGVIDRIWNAEQAGPTLVWEAQNGSAQHLCPNAPSVVGPLASPFDASIHATLDPAIAFGGTASLDDVHAAGQAAQDATVAFMQAVMQGCGAASDDATVRAFLARTDLSGSDYTGADNLVAQTYQQAGSLAAYDPSAEHQSWPFE